MPTRDPVKRAEQRRRWYKKNRQHCIEGSKRRQDVKKWRAKRKATGIPGSGTVWERMRENATRAANAGKEYWPAGCRQAKPKPTSPMVVPKPWHGLPDAEKFRVRYRLDPEFAQRQRERISDRRFLKPQYGSQWELVQGRWLRALHGQDGSITQDFLRLIRRETHCAYCGCAVPIRQRHLDHVWPLAKGGPHSADNLVMACSTCNRRKRDKLPLTFMLQCSGSLDGRTPTG